MEEGFDAAPRLYSIRFGGAGSDLIAFSVSGGKVVTETVKTNIDASEYSGLMKKSPPDIRTRDAGEIYHLYSSEYVNRFKMAAEEVRAKKTGATDRPAVAHGPQAARKETEATAGSSRAGYGLGIAGLVALLAGLVWWIIRKSARA